MKIVVAATDEQWEELILNRMNIEWQRVNDASNFNIDEQTIAYFNLKDDTIAPHYSSLDKPIFINAVTETLKELNAPKNIFRINGWATFLQRPVWELVGDIDEAVKTIFTKLGIKINLVADQPGFVSARIISMIINEAFFAVEDNVSSKEEVDTAMKLGTNYPLGPFEWCTKIGSTNILTLLQKLSINDKRYLPSGLLIKETTEIQL